MMTDPADNQIVSEFPLSSSNGSLANITFISAHICRIDEETQCIVGVVITSLGIILNTAFMFVVLRVPSMQTITNAYLVNLAVADLLLSIIHFIIWTCYLSHEISCFYDRLGYYCLFLFLTRVCQYVSILTVCIISAERYLALCKPIIFRAGIIHSRGFVKTTIVTTWIVSSVLATEGSVDCINFTQRYVAGRVLYLLAVFILMIVTIVFYILIVIQVKGSSQLQAVKKQEKQIIRICVATALIYCACNMPACLLSAMGVLEIYKVLIIPKNIYRCVNNVNVILLDVNSAVNPIAYNALSSIYRKAFKTGFYCHRHHKCCTSFAKLGRARTLSQSTEMVDEGKPKAGTTAAV